MPRERGDKAQRAQQLQSALDRERSRAEEAAKRAQQAEGGVEQKVSAAAQQAEGLKAQLEVGDAVLVAVGWLLGCVGLGSVVRRVAKHAQRAVLKDGAELDVGGDMSCSYHHRDGAYSRRDAANDDDSRG